MGRKKKVKEESKSYRYLAVTDVTKGNLIIPIKSKNPIARMIEREMLENEL